ncbi:MAG: hypothetical protein M3Y23_07745, partial [Actinomycetota bacterium]|nr:hypothetical protein [Actinomycetota bacterium]
VTVGPAAGTNELIANGAALIRDARDVIDHFIGVGVTPPRAEGPALEPPLRGVLDAVERGCSTVDMTADFVAGDAAGVAVSLARLEAMGYVDCSLVGTWSRTALPAPYPPGHD